ncbi:tannase/feruloyl esterase family alpha/beta hydrolase [Novosphingobium sediminicola]|uniref:Pimeloyl-ACP methyl ester carboxylesterase n=1 Tax=Novosphingobium sediminicola TaxID=563162 RepID=A0A7W6G502_9SPHN|nr:pimeloyl-ACP methyl ester carboxylesterase [Novosphingobium sediminicola]
MKVLNRLLAASLLSLGMATSAHAATSCDVAVKSALPKGEILSGVIVAKGGFVPPAGAGGNPAAFRDLPSFCRVEARLFPSPDSDIRVELWVPLDGWNNRLQMLGNGAYSANIQYGDLAIGLAKGYAVVAGNTGHTNDHNGDFWVGHPEKATDWQTRAVHETVVAAKQILAAMAGAALRFTYWNSCSTGGRQGWMAAQYFPDDFDGLAIGDPANPMTRLQANSIYITQALNKTPESFIPAPKWQMIHDTVLKACDAKDGLADGLVENPLACGFDPKKLLCKAGDAEICLTAPQLAALTAITQGSRNPRTGEQLYPGYPLGARLLPGPIAGKTPDTSAPITFRMLFNDPSWDYHSFDFDKDTARADELGRGRMNAVEPERLAALFARGGKILTYHGWDDSAISPLIAIKLYQDALAANGAKAVDGIRLFMIPAKGHCGNPFDQMEPLVKWVEQGIAPQTITVSYKQTGPDGQAQERLHPVCAYPKVAHYTGKGGPDDVASFACVAQKS